MAAPELNTAPQGQPFDFEHPPDVKLMDTCVHCGFCLSTCPSYRVIGKETDSPRGRIYMMHDISTGKTALTKATVQHFDSCLGCLACVTTCPSGVEYDKLISAMRPQIERNYPRSLPERALRQLIFSIFPYPQRLRLLLRPLLAYQRLGLEDWVRRNPLFKKILPKHIAAMESVLPPLSEASFQDNLPAVIPAQGTQRYRVGMLLGCVQRIFLPEVNDATVRVLTANGCEVVVPPDQGCCAALPHHQGQEEQAKTMARQLIDRFDIQNLDAVLVNASGCGHTLKEYGVLLQDDLEYGDRALAFAAKVRDVQEFLDDVGLTAQLSPLQGSTPLSLVYQDACHMLHGQKIQQQPRRLLKKIPNVKLREPVDAALCCGSAGIYNILQPEVGDELGIQKVQNLTNTKAQAIVSANVGCTVQLRKHLRLQEKTTPVFHPMQLLDYSIRGESLPLGSNAIAKN
ncbi:(Fe-S)-binding protein [Altericista sp. CCNU0014]|uniref:(Fe-S)-binding protein n=1 Tax=Altericista sp. CCNU0014 TaxID=3082949 RepID=UPI003850AE6A